MGFEPLAELFGVTRKVVVPLPWAATVIGVVEKEVTQLAAPLPDTVAVKANDRGAHPAGSLLNSVIFDVCWTLGGPEVVAGLGVSVGVCAHATTVAVTVVVPPPALIAMSFEPVAELFGVTVNVVVPVACGAIAGVVTGAKPVTQFPDPPPGTFAAKVNDLGAQPIGSLLSNVMVDVCATLGGPDVVVGLAVSVGI